MSAAADVQIREGAQEIVRAMVADQIAERQAQRERLKQLKEEIDTSFVSISAGSFEMGCSEGDKECDKNEKPRHTVRITKPFQMMKTEVTWAWFRDWALLASREPPAQPDWSGDDVPAESVTWNDAQAFCSAFGGRLPTEAEWEYAARAGTSTARYAPLDDVAWYDGNSGKQAHPVSGKKPNAFGLYDMLGNVWEWCADWYGEKFYKEGVEADPTGPSSGDMRVLRGGSWYGGPWSVRVSNRLGSSPSLRSAVYGVRCLRETGQARRARG